MNMLTSNRRWVRNAYIPNIYNKENRAVDVPEVLPAFPGGPLQRYLLRAAVIHSGDAGADITIVFTRTYTQ